MSNTAKPYVETTRRDDGWWVVDPNNDPEYQRVGPYDRLAEAEEDARGLHRFWSEHATSRLDRTEEAEARDTSEPLGWRAT